MTKRKITAYELKNWLFDLWEHNYHIKINDVNFCTTRLNMCYDKMLDNMEFYNYKDNDLENAVCIINLRKITKVCGYDIEIVDPFYCDQEKEML